MKTLKTRALVGIAMVDIVGFLGTWVACTVAPAPRLYIVLLIEGLIGILAMMLYVTRNDHTRRDISRGNRLCGYGIITFLALNIVVLSVVLFIPIQH